MRTRATKILFRNLLMLSALALSTVGLPGYAFAGMQAEATTAAEAQPATTAKTESQPEKKEADGNEAFRHSSTVSSIGKMMGMQPETAAKTFELLNFAVLAGLVLWFLGKALPKTFGARVNGIQKQLVEARTATEQANTRLSGVEQRLAKLDGEIAAIRSQAEHDSLQDEARIKASVEEDKNKMIAAAEMEIAAASTAAQRQIRQFAAELAIDQAARRISITADTDRLLVQGFAGRLISDDDKGGQN